MFVMRQILAVALIALLILVPVVAVLTIVCGIEPAQHSIGLPSVESTAFSVAAVSTALLRAPPA